MKGKKRIIWGWLLIILQIGVLVEDYTANGWIVPPHIEFYAIPVYFMFAGIGAVLLASGYEARAKSKNSSGDNDTM